MSRTSVSASHALLTLSSRGIDYQLTGLDGVSAEKALCRTRLSPGISRDSRSFQKKELFGGLGPSVREIIIWPCSFPYKLLSYGRAFSFCQNHRFG
jgi:hypothetical protein